MGQTNRYLALDVFRGMTIALMILVNTPGSSQHVYSVLQHARWHGCTLTDLVFPFFLFVMGVSLYFSTGKYQNHLDKESLLRVGHRTILIFALGLFLNSYPQWMTDYSHFRIMGVLQRIALAYAVAALIVLNAKQQWLPGIGASILIAYWGILYFFGDPSPYSLQGNATIAFDRAILGENHLYRGFGIPFDPEGILGSLPAAVTVIAGYLAGIITRENRTDHAVIRLAGYGASIAIAGYLWGFVLPVNKPLWTGSYVLYTAGLAALLFALLIYITDLKAYKKWTPLFSVFGMNPLLLFILSVVWAKTLRLLIQIPDDNGQMISGSIWLYQHVFEPLAGPMNGSLLFALAHVILFWLIGYVLYRKAIYVKV